MSRLLRIFALAAIAVLTFATAAYSKRGMLEASHPELVGYSRPLGCIVLAPLVRWHRHADALSRSAYVDHTINLVLSIAVCAVSFLLIARVAFRHRRTIRTSA